jgi:3-hydroxyisobutyrate dehydrogenase-like beta-hydroxyacid dehydrogenase
MMTSDPAAAGPGRSADEVGIIGLGRIGAGVTRALHRHGYAVCGCDVRPEAAAGIGVTIRLVSSPRQVAEVCGVVLVAVMDDAQMREVLDGDAGLLRAQRPPPVVVILSTVTVATLRWADERARPRGVGLLDCGVTGGAQSLDAGGMVGMVGGPPALVASARELLETFLAPVIEVGELGNGMRAKLARNLIGYASWLVAWEGARLALAAGIPRDRFVEVVRAGDRLNPDHVAHVAEGVGLGAVPGSRRTAAQATAGYLRKDLVAALELARELGVEVPVAELTLERCAAMFGIEDEERGDAGG